jgi:hypothetical protein
MRNIFTTSTLSPTDTNLIQNEGKSGGYTPSESEDNLSLLPSRDIST